MIANAQDEDTQGVYECMAKSPSGNVKSRSATIKHKKPQYKTRPRFTQVPSDQNVVEGKEIHLTCEAYGYPAPQINWSLNDQLVIFTERHEVRNHQLRLTNYYSLDNLI